MGNEESRRRDRLQQEEIFRRVALQQAELQAIREAARQSRLETEQQARQLTELRTRQQAEQQARLQAEQRARQQAEQQAEQQAKLQAEQRARQQARLQAEQRARQQAEQQARQQAEQQARQQAEQQARQQAEQQARQQAEQQARLQSEQRAKKQVEQRAKKQAEQQARLQTEQQARLQAEQRARQLAVQRVRDEAEQQARLQAIQEVEQQVKEEAEQQVRLQAIQQAREEAEQRANEDAEQQAGLQAKQQARQEAEQRARLSTPSTSTQRQTEHLNTSLQESPLHTSSAQRSVRSVDSTPTSKKYNNINNQRRSRSRSQSRLKPGTSKSDSTAQASPSSLRDWSKSDQDPDFNCPLCGLRFGEQIFQCERGHSACDTCRERGAACQCGAPLTSTRNLLLQAIVIERKIPCPNGCKMSVPLYKMKEHQLQYIHGDLDCPVATFDTCSWRGKLGQLVAHFDKCHPENRQGNVDKEMLLPGVTRDMRCMHLVTLGPFTFLIHLQVGDYTGKVSMVVQMLGPRVEAAKWMYEWHVYNKNEPHRKVLYMDGCCSVEESVKAIFKDDNCAVMPLVLASTMVNRECVAYKVYIKKDDGCTDKTPLYRKNAKSATRYKS